VVLRVDTLAGKEMALRNTIRTLNAKVFVHTVRSLDEMFKEKVASERVASITTGMLAILGILLSACGCFAMFSSMVHESRREIAIRMALGSTPNSMSWHVLTRALMLSLAGIAVGILVSQLGRGLLEEQFYKIDPRDSMTPIAVGLLVVGIAALSSYLPARSAAKTDPSTALKVS
jgi:ABC-type antimicrobial peptide transport system permease subunit